MKKIVDIDGRSALLSRKGIFVYDNAFDANIMANIIQKRSGIDMKVKCYPYPVVRYGNNINFILLFLLKNPGSRQKNIIKALCYHLGKEYIPGYYHSYFTKPGTGSWFKGNNCYSKFWFSVDGKYYPTVYGKKRIISYLRKRNKSHLIKS